MFLIKVYPFSIRCVLRESMICERKILISSELRICKKNFNLHSSLFRHLVSIPLCGVGSHPSLVLRKMRRSFTLLFTYFCSILYYFGFYSDVWPNTGIQSIEINCSKYISGHCEDFSNVYTLFIMRLCLSPR